MGHQTLARILPVSVSLSEVQASQLRLRRLPSSLVPQHIGGTKATPQLPAGSDLKKELISRAASMRPNLEETYKKHQPSPLLKKLLAEIHELAESDHLKPEHESPLRPKYALDSFLAQHQDWPRLQAEVRQCRPRLRPVLFEDFYVIRSPSLPV